MLIIPKPAYVKLDFRTFPMPSAFAVECEDYGTFIKFNQILQVFENIEIVKENGNIIVKQDDKMDFYYKIKIKDNKIKIIFKTEESLFYALVTMRQMLYKAEKIHCGEVADKYRYDYRGIMIDVASHFVPYDGLVEIVDMMANYKLNKLHLHLTGNHGWRVEIKKYPLLATKGAVRKGTQITKGGEIENTEYGEGLYYTQDQLKALVEYAKERFVEIIPEVDMPSRMRSAIYAYSELSCKGKPIENGVKWNDENILACIGKEDIYEFAKTVITELSSIFESKYFDVGGYSIATPDWKKCPQCLESSVDTKVKKEKDLLSIFYSQINTVLQQLGKEPIMWDNNLCFEKPQDTVLQMWNKDLKESESIKWMKTGGKTIMSYAPNFSFDYSYAKTPLSKTYGFDMMFIGIPINLRKQVLGLEACLWTEWVRSKEKLQYCLYPRMQAFAEKCWTTHSLNYLDFEYRLISHFKFMKDKNLDFCPINKANGTILRRLKYSVKLAKSSNNGEVEMKLK